MNIYKHKGYEELQGFFFVSSMNLVFEKRKLK